MFHMMNEARLGVTCHKSRWPPDIKSLVRPRAARAGPVTAKDPAAPQVPIIDHPDVKRMLLAQKAHVEARWRWRCNCGRLVDVAASPESPAEAESRTGCWTSSPRWQSWPSQWCLEANSLAIQVHGGYGHTREYDVEQHYRDNRLNPIHEGNARRPEPGPVGTTQSRCRWRRQRGGAGVAVGGNDRRGGARPAARRRNSPLSWTAAGSG